MTDLPAPPIDADADLRAYPYMPLDVVRLRDSGQARGDLAALGMAVLTWCAAWHQVPAGSLPDDDGELAWLLGFGRDVATWIALKERGAMRGWAKCSDGRLYHPAVAEKANEAWSTRRNRLKASRLAHRGKKGANRTRDARESRASLLSSPLLSADGVAGAEKAPEVTGDTRARVEAAAPDDDPNDLTTPRPGDPPTKPALRIVADLSPDIGLLDQLRFAGARIQRDDAGTWLLAVRAHGLERVVQVVLAIVGAGEAPWWSTVSAWLAGKRAAGGAAQPNDGWHYPRDVLFDAEGPHVFIDGVRHRFTPSKKLADMKREREAR